MVETRSGSASSKRLLAAPSSPPNGKKSKVFISPFIFYWIAYLTCFSFLRNLGVSVRIQAAERSKDSPETVSSDKELEAGPSEKHPDAVVAAKSLDGAQKGQVLFLRLQKLNLEVYLILEIDFVFAIIGSGCYCLKTRCGENNVSWTGGQSAKEMLTEISGRCSLGEASFTMFTGGFTIFF